MCCYSSVCPKAAWAVFHSFSKEVIFTRSLTGTFVVLFVCSLACWLAAGKARLESEDLVSGLLDEELIVLEVLAWLLWWDMCSATAELHRH